MLETGATAAVAQGLQDVMREAGCPKEAIHTEMRWTGQGQAVEITIRCLRDTLDTEED